MRSDTVILFKWIREPNIVKVTGITNIKGLEIKAAHLQINKAKEPFTFTVIAQSLPGPDTFYLLSNGKVIFKKQLLVVKPQPVKAILGTITDSAATIQQIVSYASLRAIIPDCKCFSGHVIARFTVRFESTHLQEWQKEVTIVGNKLEQLNVIRQLQPNDKIVFSNISTIDVDSFPLKLPDFTITIR